MSFVLQFAGILLICLLCVFLFTLAFCIILFLSRISLIFDYSESLDIFLKIWFAKINITKLMSHKKKQKKPEVLHFSGGSFGKFPEKSKLQKEKAADLHSQKKSGVAKSKKSISETLDFIKELLSELSPYLSKCALVKINRLHLTAASAEAADTAILFGHFNTALSSLILVCKKYSALYINDGCVGVYSDFTTDKPLLDANIEIQFKVKYVGISSFKGIMFFLNSKNK